MDYPDELKRQMDRAAIERQRAEDAKWLEIAKEAKKGGNAPKEAIDKFINDFSDKA